MKNPKTTTVGILGLISALCGIGVKILNGQIATITPDEITLYLAAISAGAAAIGNIFSKDHNQP